MKKIKKFIAKYKNLMYNRKARKSKKEGRISEYKSKSKRRT